jgi:hypothetical protein
VRRLIDVMRGYFRDIGAEAFTVITEEHWRRIFDV